MAILNKIKYIYRNEKIAFVSMCVLPKLTKWIHKYKLLSLYLCITHILLILLVLVPNFSAKISKKLGKEHPNYSVIYNYQSMNTMLSRIDQNLNENTTLFIGDSLTQGMAVTNILPYAVNFGIGHDTVNGVLQRIKSYESIKRVAKVIVTVGINDLRKKPVEAVIVNYIDLLNELEKRHRHVYIHEVLPIDEKIMGKKLQNKITLFNQHLNKISKSFTNVHFLQKSMEFIDNTGNLKASLHLGDGLHLNSNGYSIWIKQLKKQLKINDKYN